MDRAAYEKLFADYLGAQSVIWLDSGIAGDDTHGHVDDITRFVAPNTVLTMVEQDERSENYAPLRANLGRLKNARTAEGKKLDIVELPMPRPVVFKGRQLPASYANFYIANGAVLVPVFNDPNDRIALNTLAELFPDPRNRTDLFGRSDLGIRRAPLHDAAATGCQRPAVIESRNPGLLFFRFRTRMGLVDAFHFATVVFPRIVGTCLTVFVSLFSL